MKEVFQNKTGFPQVAPHIKVGTQPTIDHLMRLFWIVTPELDLLEKICS